MRHTAAETREPSPVFTPTEYHEVTVKIENGEANTYPQYIGVQPNGVAQITWTLDSNGLDMKFDNPAITLFGETPNVIWFTPEERGVRTALWINDDPQRSFCYRVHLLWTMPDGKIVPITDDPIIHNDPPSDV